MARVSHDPPCTAACAAVDSVPGLVEQSASSVLGLSTILRARPVTMATTLSPQLFSQILGVLFGLGLGLEVLPGLFGGRESGFFRMLSGPSGLGAARFGEQV